MLKRKEQTQSLNSFVLQKKINFNINKKKFLSQKGEKAQPIKSDFNPSTFLGSAPLSRGKNMEGAASFFSSEARKKREQEEDSRLLPWEKALFFTPLRKGT